jgi:hypothetical protein
MVTDDARIVDAKACQVEAWSRFTRGATELWALPACNPFGFAELTFGGSSIREHGEGHAFTDEVLQAKMLLRPLEPDNWGAGFAIGTFRHPRREKANGWPGDPYAYVPVSFAFDGDAWVVHVNAGVVHRRDEGRNMGTWGVGNEIRLSERLYFIPEMFGNDRGRPFYQVGARYWVLKDRMQVDATFGNRLVADRNDGWISIGLRLLSPPFLP